MSYLTGPCRTGRVAVRGLEAVGLEFEDLHDRRDLTERVGEKPEVNGTPSPYGCFICMTTRGSIKRGEKKIFFNPEEK